MQKNKIEPIPYTRINSNWIKDLNTRNSIKFLKENVEGNLCDLDWPKTLRYDTKNMNNRIK